MKKALSILLLIVLITGMSYSTCFASNRNMATETAEALELKSLGLFYGLTDTDLGLDKTADRAQALVMLIRLLGKADEAKNGTYSHPFTDAPAWADKYIGYAYANNLTSGASATSFGNGTVTSKMFASFVLRALGYEAGKDFSYNTSLDFARDAKVLPDNIDTDQFVRGDMASIAHAALSANIKNSNKTLADSLIEQGVFSKESFDKVFTVYSDEAPIVLPLDEITESDLSEGSEITDRNSTIPTGDYTYVLNVNPNGNYRFHYADCKSVKKMNEENKKYVNWTREYIISQGFTPCGNCNP